MVMRWLIQEWIAQWLGLRDRLRDRQREGDGWWVEMRERILRFLVSRYVHEDEQDAVTLAAAREAHERGDDAAGERRTFCRVTPEYHPPRSCADMAGKLRSVSWINATKRARWRWI